MPDISVKKENISGLTIWFFFILTALFYFAYSLNFYAAAEEPRWVLLNISSLIIPLMILIDAYAADKKIDLVGLNSPHFILIIFSLWSLVSLSWSFDAITLVDEYINNVSWVLLVLSFSYLARRIDLDKVILPLCLMTTLTALFGLMQCYGLDGDLYHQFARPAATFLNKNVATPVVVMVLPLMCFRILFCQSDKLALVLTVGVATNIAYLVLAVTRSSWVGAFLSCGIVFVIVFNNKVLRRYFSEKILLGRIVYLGIAVLLALVLVVIYEKGTFPVNSRALQQNLGFLGLLGFGVFGFSVIGIAFRFVKPIIMKFFIRKRNAYLLVVVVFLFFFVLLGTVFTQTGFFENDLAQRITVYAGKSSSFSQRLAIWLNTLPLVKENFLLGIGLDGFDAVYPLYHNSIADHSSYTGHLWQGGLHSEPLQLLLELGVIGFLIFVAFSLRLGKSAFRNIELSDDKYLYLSLVTGLVGGVIDSIFNSVYHYPTSLFVTAIMVGILMSSRRIVEGGAVVAEPGGNSPKRKIVLLSGIFILLSFLVLASVFSFNRIRAMTDHKRAFFHRKVGNFYKASVLVKGAVDRWPYSKIVNYHASFMLFDFYQRVGSPPSNWGMVESYNNKALESMPYYYDLNLGRILLMLDSNDRREIEKSQDFLPILFRVAPESEKATVNRLRLDIKKRLATMGGQ